MADTSGERPSAGADPGYRQGRLESDLRDLRGAVTALGVNIDQRFSGIETKLDVLRSDAATNREKLPDAYIGRREYTEGKENVNEDTQRVYRDLDRRVQSLEDGVHRLTWTVLGALITGLGGVLFLTVKAGLHL